MPTITIQGTPIDFPDDRASPDWAPGVIAFAVAVQNALETAVGPFDVQAQSFDISAYNSASNISLPGLAFPIGEVRAAFIDYAIFRTTSTSNAYEAGKITAIYVPGNSPGSIWVFTNTDITGIGGQVVFNITDAGQVQFTSTALGGLDHTGQIAFSATVLLQS